MSKNRIGGMISLKVNGDIYFAKGNFTYNLGKPKREGVVGADVVHGYKETPQIPFIEGEITDRNELRLEELVTLDDSTITLSEAWYAGEGTGNTEEGNIACRFEGMSCEEVA